jgi:phosphoribosylaminoimidazole-succinocarboxamide synthase
MLSADAILQAIPQALGKFEVPGDLPHGKVYDFYVTADGKRRVLIATDRLTIFDQLVGLIPYKGQALNELSAWCFKQTTDIIPNHLDHLPDPNVLIAHEARAIPLVVVVRGYITGMTPTSLWTRYAAGEREIYGFKFPSGLKKNDPLPHAIVTPTTKSTVGHEDRQPLSNVVDNHYLSAAEWEQVQAVALALFKRGQAMAARGGLILVDSKYEFGYAAETGSLILIDELHTPESSRYWKADTYADHVATGYEPHNLDRELARLWYATRGYDLKKPLPPISEDLIVSISQAYQQVYEMITGQMFQPAAYPAQDRIHTLLTKVA